MFCGFYHFILGEGEDQAELKNRQAVVRRYSGGVTISVGEMCSAIGVACLSCQRHQISSPPIVSKDNYL